LYIFLFSKTLKWVEGLRKIIIIAPHPDDEILGLGGLILYLMDEKTDVHIVYLTDGEGSGVWPDKEEIKKQRIKLSESVCNKIGIKNSRIHRLHLPDGKVPFRDEIIFKEVTDSIRILIDTIQPDAVFTTHYLEYWPYDHVAAYEIAVEAVNRSVTKPQLWCYWVWTWINIRPESLFNLLLKEMRKITIGKYYLQKKELKDIYLKESNPDGKPWSGVLPDPLIKALKNPVEIVERVI
jgi:LmbE family N-acetylglucosaminyl deacetylase